VSDKRQNMAGNAMTDSELGGGIIKQTANDMAASGNS
jgi:hypothetical protein